MLFVAPSITRCALHLRLVIVLSINKSSLFAIHACREACYSDLDCNYWQYIQETGCWSEAASENSNVRNPLTNGNHPLG